MKSEETLLTDNKRTKGFEKFTIFFVISGNNLIHNLDMASKSPYRDLEKVSEMIEIHDHFVLTCSGLIGVSHHQTLFFFIL